MTGDRRDMVTLEELRGRIGETLGVSDWLLMDQARITAFGEITQDPQFIHMDPARAAAETPFGGTIAHGFLTLSLLSGMNLQVFPQVKDRVMTINYGLDKVRFLAPVPSGARVRGRFVLEAIEKRKAGQFLCRITSTVEIEGVAKPALIAEQLALYVMGQAA